VLLRLLRQHAEPGLPSKGMDRSADSGCATAQGVSLVTDGTFVPGASGRDWPRPEDEDLARIQTEDLAATPWEKVSWQQVDCCQKLADDKVWEDVDTGVPECLCRDILTQSRYKTTAVCNLRQACENALRDFNRVFGEGYMHPGLAPTWDTESPARTCLYSKWGGGWRFAPCGRKNHLKSEVWTDPHGRETVVHTDVLPSKKYGTREKAVAPDSEKHLHEWQVSCVVGLFCHIYTHTQTHTQTHTHTHTHAHTHTCVYTYAYAHP